MNIRLLKNKNLLIILFSTFINVIGSNMQSFALSLYVLNITGSATKFASVCAVALIPRILLGPFAGVFIDWFDRKKMIIMLDSLNGVIVLGFVIIFKTYGHLSLIQIYILTIALSITSILYNPAAETLIPSILTKNDLLDGNSMITFAENFGSLIAPTIGGIILSFANIYIIMIINVVSFFIASGSEIFLKLSKINKNKSKLSFVKFKKDLLEGFNFVKGSKSIICIAYLALILNFAFSGMAYIGYIYICKKILRVSDFEYGIFQTSIAVSMVISPLIIKFTSKKLNLGKLTFWGMFSISMILILISLDTAKVYLNLFSSNLIPYLVLIVLVFSMAAIALIVNIAIHTSLQQKVHIEMLGRVITLISTIATLATPLGQMIFGVLFDVLPAWVCIFITSICVLITILKFKKNLYCFDADNNEECSNKPITFN